MKTTLLGPQRPDIVEALSDLATTTVDSTSGLTGMALKSVLKAATAVREDIVPHVIDRILPDLADALDPYWRTYSAGVSAETFGAYLHENAEPVSADLARIADAYAKDNAPASLHRVYTSARNKGVEVLKKHLEQLGNTLEEFMD